MTLSCPARHWARAAPRKAALKFEARWWSYEELDLAVGRWAALLRLRDANAGSPIALLCGNRPEVVFLAHAVARIGAAIAPLNTRLTHAELEPLVERLSPALVIAEDRLRDRIPGAKSLESLAEKAAGLDVLNSSGSPELDCLSADRLFAVLFTSGTTGTPKGVELTVGNFTASARASAENLGGDADQRWLACLPFFHVGGLAMLTRTAWYGAALIVQSRFDPDAVIASMQADGITHLSLVENALEQTLSAAKRFPPTLRAALVGGGPVSIDVLGRARRRGVPALQTYGLTEATSQVATERIGQADGETAGVALQGVSVRVADSSGMARPAGEVGEIQVRGPTVMRGYWSDSDSTSRALGGGWLHTGDVGALDERGRLTVFARRTDLIISGGENVYPAEVERVLAEHPNVADIAVVSRDDSRWGQVPVAAVVPRGERPSAADLERWSRSRLAPFKVPTRWVSFQALPRSASGKIDRLAVRQMIDRALEEEIAAEP